MLIMGYLYEKEMSIDDDWSPYYFYEALVDPTVSDAFYKRLNSAERKAYHTMMGAWFAEEGYLLNEGADIGDEVDEYLTDALHNTAAHYCRVRLKLTTEESSDIRHAASPKD